MQLIDVNVLVYAFREDTPRHREFKRWLDQTVRSDAAYAVSGLILSGFLRVVTHPKVFRPATPLAKALEFTEAFRGEPNAVPLRPDVRHWEIFTRLCRASAARGNLIPDAWLAALAIESGSEFITADRDFARFDGLRWRHPIDS